MTQPPKIRAEITRTINLGNFESVKISIGMEDYVLNTDKTNEDCFNRIYSFVEDKMNEKTDEINGITTPKKPSNKTKIIKNKKTYYKKSNADYYEE